MLRHRRHPIWHYQILGFHPEISRHWVGRATAPQRYLQGGRRHPWMPLPPATTMSMHDFHPEPSLPPTNPGSEATSATEHHNRMRTLPITSMLKPHAETRQTRANLVGPPRRTQAWAPNQIRPSSASMCRSGRGTAPQCTGRAELEPELAGSTAARRDWTDTKTN